MTSLFFSFIRVFYRDEPIFCKFFAFNNILCNLENYIFLPRVILVLYIMSQI